VCISFISGRTLFLSVGETKPAKFRKREAFLSAVFYFNRRQN
jgi:hypothetical protein